MLKEQKAINFHISDKENFIRLVFPANESIHIDPFIATDSYT